MKAQQGLYGVGQAAILDREQVDVERVETGVIGVKVEVKVAIFEVIVLDADFGFIMLANDARQ